MTQYRPPVHAEHFMVQVPDYVPVSVTYSIRYFEPSTFQLFVSKYNGQSSVHRICIFNIPREREQRLHQVLNKRHGKVETTEPVIPCVISTSPHKGQIIVPNLYRIFAFPLYQYWITVAYNHLVGLHWGSVLVIDMSYHNLLPIGFCPLQDAWANTLHINIGEYMAHNARDMEVNHWDFATVLVDRIQDMIQND